MTREEIFSKVRTAIADALGLDEDEVTPTASLTKDLGAESIDFLDITFRLEQAFSFKIAQGELFPANAASDPDYVQDGRVTAKGIAAMKARMPHVDFADFESDPQLSRVGSLFTVDALVRFVETKLGT